MQNTAFSTLSKTNDTQRINVKLATCRFVPNSVSYLSAKYYMKWSTVEKVIAKIKG